MPRNAGLRPRLLAPFLFLTTFASAAHADGGGCFLQVPPPPVRKIRDLTVISPARPQPPPPGLRLRTHARVQDHMWIGSDVPAFVPLEIPGNMKLDLLDRTEGVYIALYRERIENCALVGAKNCAAEVRLFDCNGLPIVSAPLAPYFSRRDQLEVQDVRYSGGTVYFNEACQSYSREAGGRCSSLVALDPFQRRVLWRTPTLVSNNYFVVMGDYVVTAYGFTSEPGSIRVIRRSDGAIVDRKPLEGTNFEMTTNGDLVTVNLYYDRPSATFRLTPTGASATLVRVPAGTAPSMPLPQASTTPFALPPLAWPPSAWPQPPGLPPLPPLPQLSQLAELAPLPMLH